MITQLSIKLPSSDLSFLQELSEKMGWSFSAHTSSAKEESKSESRAQKVQRLRDLCAKSTITPNDIATDDRLKYILDR